MLIRVESLPIELLELLWIREAWEIHVGGNSPRCLVTPPRSEGTHRFSARWEDRWPHWWNDAVNAVTTARSPIFGPQRPWKASLTPRFSEWLEDRHSEVATGLIVPLESTPERLAASALGLAWDAGLTQIVTIPTLGNYSHRLNEQTLLLAEVDRMDPNRYPLVLTQFASGHLPPLPGHST